MEEQYLYLFTFILLAIIFSVNITKWRYEKKLREQMEQEYNYRKRYEERVKAIYEEMLQKACAENLASFPWMAQQIADVYYLFDIQLSDYLAYKKRPAIKASEAVSQCAKQKKELQARYKALEYQLAYYETIFPWLEEFKEIPPIEASKMVKEIDADPQSEYETLKNWLSPEEYQQLTPSKKYQLALDRYLKKNKSNWEIGRDFERYIGYSYEQNGYRVRYQGAVMGLEDMGRDLIASKGNEMLVIQCKHWSAQKTIHEKHIFQLYGTTVLLRIESKKQQDIKGLFITTCSVSDLAKKCADYLDIQVVENTPIADYPLIKCNISKRTGEKIYHLPFDQQYDKVVIEPNRGEFYAYTVAEAEEKGFRHAWRWHPGDD